MTRPQWYPGAAPQSYVWLWGAPARCTEAPKESDGRGNAAGPGQASFACISPPCSVRRDLPLIFIFTLITALPAPYSLTPTLLLSHD